MRVKTISYIISVVPSLINLVSGQNTVGLMLNEPGAFVGYTLFAPNNSTTTYLIDNGGLLVNYWESAYTPGLTVYLLEDGHLLRSAAIVSDNHTQTGGFQKFSWDNTLIWEFYYGTQHHDIEPLPNGNVLMIVNDVKSRNEAISAGRDPALITSNNLRSLSILEIAQVGSDSGVIVWEWRSWDHIVQDFDSTKANYGNVAQLPELIDINFAPETGSDWLHTNSIDYHAGLDQIVVSNRNSDDIWIIDHSTTTTEAASHSGGNSGRGGDLLYRWGNPVTYRAGTVDDQKLFGQHDARWITPGLNGAGNIIMFNNGYERLDGAYSTINEIILPVDLTGNYNLSPGAAFDPPEPAWTYIAADSFSFNSPRFGSSHRLPNGNTLICSSDNGSFFEVTPAFEVIWNYINPVARDGILAQGDSAVLNTVARCFRYAPDYPGLIGHDLTPGEPIELYLVIDDSENSNITEFRILSNYPNPFNPVTTIQYELWQRSEVRITIYDVLGKEATTLLSETQDAGYKSIQWDATNFSSGIYFCQINAEGSLQTRKMVLLK